MPTYVTLGRYTQFGIQNIKESPARLDRAKQLAASMGAELKAFYLTMGQYDIAAIIEAPDEETAAKLILGIGATGAVSTETLRAFTEDEYRTIIGALP